MGFGGLEAPKDIPTEIKNKIVELENKSGSELEYLQVAYDFVTSRWHAGRLETIFYVPLAFRTNLSEILGQPGYGHCNTQNYFLYVLLVKSKYFKPEDIKLKTVFFNFFIHQYLQVRISGKFMDADPAGASIRGKQLGQRISFFG